MARKRTRLSATPEEHKQRAGYWAKMARHSFTEVSREAPRSCRAALENLISGHENYARTIDNAFGDYLGDLITDADLRKFNSARKQFVSHCLVGGGLSGMRRRRR